MAATGQTFIQAPAPWQCKAQVYSMYFLSRPDKTSMSDLSAMMYSPLEAASEFASAKAGFLSRGLAGFMIIQYSETPVGPYDELIIIPGPYTWSAMENGKLKQHKNPRVSRVYVSQKDTAYNGRLNWNIPKHLARFTWRDLPDGGRQVQIFPFDTTDDPTEATASAKPFFQAAFRKIPLIPAFPFSTGWAGYLGLDLALVQPPVPQGTSSELVGTDKWCKCLITQDSARSHVGWFDLSQKDEDGKSEALFENFWPSLGRWHLGIKMDDANIFVPKGEYWKL